MGNVSSIFSTRFSVILLSLVEMANIQASKSVFLFPLDKAVTAKKYDNRLKIWYQKFALWSINLLLVNEILFW